MAPVFAEPAANTRKKLGKILPNYLECIRKTLFEDINLKYPNFNTLSNPDKILFIFNNIDPFICKKLGYFIFEAFQKRKQ